MIRGSISSSQSEKCVICGRKTPEYQTYNSLGIEIQIPVHESADTPCYKQLDVNTFAALALGILTEAIRKGGGKL